MQEPSARMMRMLTSTVWLSDRGVLLLDADGRVEWMNPTAERMFVYTTEELLGTPFTEVLFGASADAASELFKQVRDGGKVDGRQVTVRRGDGVLIATVMSVMGLEEGPDYPGGISIIARDVTEENVHIRELARLQDRLRTGFVQATMPQAFLDLDGRIEEINDAMALLLGHDRRALKGEHVLRFLDSDETGNEASRRAIKRALVEGSARYEVAARHHEGHLVFLLVDLNVLTDESGRRRALTIFARDVSDVREAQERLAAQEAFFGGLNRQAWDLAFVTDVRGRLTYVSPSAVQFVGIDPGELVGRGVVRLLHSDDLQRAGEMLRAVLAEPDSVQRALLRLRHRSGEWIWVEATTTNAIDVPAIGGIVANLRDVSTEVTARQDLERSEARHRAIVQTAQEGIIALSPEGETVLANEKLAELVGIPLDQLYELGLWAALEPESARMLHGKLLNRAATGPERYEVSFTDASGGERVLSISATPMSTEASGGIGSLAMVSDVTAQRRAAEELRYQALHDPLTGLPNRALLTDRLEVAAARLQREPDGGLAVIFLDLDHLKLVNDRAGHAAGDALLVEVSRRLQSVLRQSDTVARLGGDEFAVICEETTAEGAIAVARRIQGTFVEPFHVTGSPVRVSASIGLAMSPPNPADDLLRLADTAMYQAKIRSRGSYVIYDSSIAQDEERRRELCGDLRDALTTDAVFLHYQPVVDLEDQRIRGIEALVRWKHPERGMLPALELIAAAQEAGLETELDKLVLRAACMEMGRLVRAGVMGPDSYVSVNISARSASVERIDMLVPGILADAQIGAQQLMLEVTETSIMTDVEHTVRQLRALTELGVRVAVDDFGTGYSSLSYLHRLPLGILKIDRSFVSGLPDDPESSTIVRSVIGLAESLGLHTIAEGIETQEQAAALLQLGCKSGQGFLWSRAVPPAALDDVRDALARLPKNSDSAAGRVLP